jgi:hypothetical protein
MEDNVRCLKIILRWDKILWISRLFIRTFLKHRPQCSMDKYQTKLIQVLPCSLWTSRLHITLFTPTLNRLSTMVLQVSRILPLTPSSSLTNSYQAHWDCQLSKIQLQLHQTINSLTSSTRPLSSTTNGPTMATASQAIRYWPLDSECWETNHPTKWSWWIRRVLFTCLIIIYVGVELMATRTLKTIGILIAGGSFR